MGLQARWKQEQQIWHSWRLSPWLLQTTQIHEAHFHPVTAIDFRSSLKHSLWPILWQTREFKKSPKQITQESTWVQRLQKYCSSRFDKGSTIQELWEAKVLNHGSRYLTWAPWLWSFLELRCLKTLIILLDFLSIN